jgi:DNA-binding winged helix-turn-helix (wHTH) protein
LTTSPNFLYEFGGYRLDVAESLLLRDGTAIALPPKTLAVLALLVRRAGNLVDRDTLMRELWPDSFVEEANIARHIWTLRQVFGGDVFIETVPKRGYRFVAPVRASTSVRTLPASPVTRDVTANRQARESYERANQLAQHPADHQRALSLYQECVTADPEFAPAWARLGRLYRVMSKYEASGKESHRLAEDALERALALAPDLPLVVTQYALLEVDLGRGVDAMTRLLRRAREHRNDADLLAGLVHACRYTGLLDASVAAHRRAVAIDPLIATSVVQSYWMSGDMALALAESSKLTGGSLRPMVLALAGRDAEAIAYLKAQEPKLPYERMVRLCVALRALLEGDRAASLAALDWLLLNAIPDPEAHYFYARYLARLGEVERANDALAAAVFGGFIASRVMAWDPWLDPLRGSASFQAVQAQADARRLVALRSYIDAGGEETLGPVSAA